MALFRLFIAAIVSCTMVLSGCVTNAPSGPSVGPQFSSLINKAKRLGAEPYKSTDPNRPKLDIIIPVFDPGLPKKGESSDADVVWPELRRAEAVRFANKLKGALEDTAAFGAVRVTPDQSATGDLYVLGKIVKSDGEDVEFDMQVFDISGRQWLHDTVSHTVDPSFHTNIRNNGKDPYDPVFVDAAKQIAEELSYQETAALSDLKRLTDLRFGASLVDAAFSEHLALKDGQYSLASFPSDSDPMLARTKAVRVRDQLFVDGLQSHYQLFSDKMDSSYKVWQEQALIEKEAKRKAENKATGETLLGVLAIGLAVAAVAAGAKSNNPNAGSAGVAAGAVGAVVGAKLIGDGFQTRKEAEVHRDALQELGQSMDADLAPTVVAFEEKTVELTGTGQQQFAQWRNFLKTIYLQEQTPNVKL